MCVFVNVWVHLIAVSHMREGKRKLTPRNSRTRLAFYCNTYTPMNVMIILLLLVLWMVCMHSFYCCCCCFSFFDAHCWIATSSSFVIAIVHRGYNKNWYPALWTLRFLSFWMRQSCRCHIVVDYFNVCCLCLSMKMCTFPSSWLFFRVDTISNEHPCQPLIMYIYI